MKIDEALVDKIAGLARLRFTDDERRAFAEQFSDIVAFVEQLSEVDTSGIDILDVHGQKQAIPAEDKTRQWLSQDEALENAPFSDGTYFLVPKVIEGEEE